MNTSVRCFLVQLLCFCVLMAAGSVAGVYAQGRYQDASTRLLTPADVEDLSNAELKIMRNEIFARYGYIFKTKDMKEYFGSQPWYRGVATDVTKKLTEIEKKNIELIKAYESGSVPRAEPTPTAAQRGRASTTNVILVYENSGCHQLPRGTLAWTNRDGRTHWRYYTEMDPDIVLSTPDLEPLYRGSYSGVDEPRAEVASGDDLIIYGGGQVFLDGAATLYDTYCASGFGIITPKGNRIGRVGDVSVRGLYSDQLCELPSLVRLEDGSVAILSTSSDEYSDSKIQTAVLEGVQHPVSIVGRMMNSYVIQSAGQVFYADARGAIQLPFQGKITIHDTHEDACFLSVGNTSYYLKNGTAVAVPFKKPVTVKFAREGISCDTDCDYSVATEFLVEQDGNKIVVFDTTTLLTHTLAGWKDQGIVVDCSDYDHYVKNVKTGNTVTLRSLIPNE